MRRTVVILAAVGLAGSGTAWGRPIQLVSSGPWHLNYADERCTLSRGLGTEDKPVVIQFEQSEPGRFFALNLIGEVFGVVRAFDKVGVRFGNSGPVVRSEATVGTVAKLPMLFLQAQLPNDGRGGPSAADHQSAALTPAQEAAITSVELTFAGRTIALELGPLHQPIEALRACTADLVKTWGLDPAEQAALRHGPTPQQAPGTWLRSDDYPTVPLVAGQQAIIDFRLLVDAAGHPTACVIQNSIAQDKAFSDRSCALIMQRARFAPAQRADGTPIASFYANRVRWIITPR